MVVVERWCYGPQGVFGTLMLPRFTCYTVERPWLKNEPGVSCIPVGDYPLALDHYHKGDYPAYEIRDVPNRSRILIHVANTMLDVKGCIAPGKWLGALADKQGELGPKGQPIWGVLGSRDAFDAFMDCMHGITETTIRIQNVGPFR